MSDKASPQPGPILGINTSRKEIKHKVLFYCVLAHILKEISVITSPQKCEVDQCEKMSRI